MVAGALTAPGPSTPPSLAATAPGVPRPSPSPPPPALAGLRIVPAAVALGIPFTNPPAAPVIDWASRMSEARRRLQKISRMALSMFGRATAAAAYALHMATYHMEHSGLPPAEVLAGIMALVAKLVDRELGPDDAQRRFTGVPLRLLSGHPTIGGFGVLPLRLHVLSRHAKWSLTVARSALQPPAARAPWIRIAASFLSTLHPAFRPLAVTTARPDGPWLGAPFSLPPDIHRLATSLGHLPPLSDVADPPLEPGVWCFNAPLWGNPLLPNAGAPGRRPGLEAIHGPLTMCRRLLTVGDAVRVQDAMTAFEVERAHALATTPGMAIFSRMAERWTTLVRHELAPSELAMGALQDRIAARAAVAALLSDISPAWLAAARLAPDGPAPPSPDEVDALLLARLGWRLGVDAVLPLTSFTVKLGTLLLAADLERPRQACHAAYVREALGLSPAVAAPPEAALVALRAVWRRLWKRVKWEPRWKEVLWRLAVDGVPMPGSSHLPLVPPEPCACGCYPAAAGVAESPRLHHFWSCPLVRPLWDELEVCCGCGVTREHVWLCVSPDPTTVLQCVWDVVALAALNAMEWTRRYIHSHRLSGPALPAAMRSGLLAKFWALLRDFAALGLPRKGWGDVGVDHPFLFVTGGRLVCAMPP